MSFGKSKTKWKYSSNTKLYGKRQNPRILKTLQHGKRGILWLVKLYIVTSKKPKTCCYPKTGRKYKFKKFDIN